MRIARLFLCLAPFFGCSSAPEPTVDEPEARAPVKESADEASVGAAGGAKRDKVVRPMECSYFCKKASSAKGGCWKCKKWGQVRPCGHKLGLKRCETGKHQMHHLYGCHDCDHCGNCLRANRKDFEGWWPLCP